MIACQSKFVFLERMQAAGSDIELKSNPGPYVGSPFLYTPFQTREVKIGTVGVGGKNPIRVQSMTIADTLDTEATVKESIELIEAGCEIVRITAPRVKEAENLKNIKNRLVEMGYNTPIVADIHFLPQAAMTAVEYVEKVRINPGNFADRKFFEMREYSDSEYEQELERIHDAFKPLVIRARELGRVLRIGTNHGSLSDRIMNRYGDTPLGMVESAIEFIQIAEQYDFRDIVVSMKASNAGVMIQAYRMLVARFLKNGMNYPLHLGVTEAGGGNDGRIKSSVGIGSLLDDGLGDTIRVSLTEDSIHEIPVAKQIARYFNTLREKNSTETKETIHLSELSKIYETELPYFDQKRRVSESLAEIGGSLPVKVGMLSSMIESAQIPGLKFRGLDFILENHAAPGASENSDKAKILSISLDQIIEIPLYDIENDIPLAINRIKNSPRTMVTIICETDAITRNHRALVAAMSNASLKNPILLSHRFENEDDARYRASIHFGSLLLDGIGDAILIDVRNSSKDSCDWILQLSLDILQATRLRLSKTEFISCPSCGRTLFNLQDTTARIQKRTGHLKGVKIAIMGCVVNGPGEMADADFGYVGAGPGKIHLYKGKEIVKKSIPEESADEELVNLIKENGMWVD